jgi:hypothetical protein
MIEMILAAALAPQPATAPWFGVALREPIAQVRATLGDPLDENDLGDGITKSRYFVDGNTAILGVDRKNGVVVMLSVTSAGSQMSDAADPFGVKLGTAESAVEHQRGKPDATDNGDGADRLLYGNGPTWHYIFRNGVLGMIIVSAPPSATVASATIPDPPLHTGASLADAIVIKNENATTGVDWEYAYLALHPCTATVRRKLLKQALITQGKRAYDALTTQCPGQPQQTLYFDITDYLGKL